MTHTVHLKFEDIDNTVLQRLSGALDNNLSTLGKALNIQISRRFADFTFIGELAHAGRRALLSLAVVSITKNLSATSCPWDLAQFGGVARHVSHWALGVLDGGSGRCFPAGHASAGFAFLGGYFALRHKAPTAARWWLAGALLAGFVLGAAQQVRGAHFMSHTLWTGWLCWTTGWLCDLAATALRPRFPHFARTATPADGSHA